jgi:hypothetical protein
VSDDKARALELVQELRRLGREIFAEPCCGDPTCDCASDTYVVTVEGTDDSSRDNPLT